MECKDGVYVSGIHDGDYIKVREVDLKICCPSVFVCLLPVPFAAGG